MNSTEWLSNPVKSIDQALIEKATAYQNTLTKPPGSLGMLEEVAIRLSAMQQTQQPALSQVNIVIFAADHGIAEEGVSAFPQAVTAEMIKNFSRGGAAISVLAKELEASLEVINLGTVMTLDELPGVRNLQIAAGTANFYRQPAMSEAQLSEALQTGYEAVERAGENHCELFIAGDMGIANTSAASALACAATGVSAAEMTGRGTGLDDQGLSHKVNILDESLKKYSLSTDMPLDILRTFGGFEIAAMTAAYIRCAQRGIPALVDGFIASAAALLASRINSEVMEWLFFAHASAEPGHKLMMQSMQAKPLVDLNMRLGEASGAAVVVPLMRLACALNNKMHTFEQAGVSEGNA